MVRFVIFFIMFFLMPQLSIAEEAMRLPVDSAALVIKTKAEDIHYHVEIASSREQCERGLMYRHDFPAGQAMLFKFAELRNVSMWMANTPLPLDMIFLNEQGQIVSIHENATPYSYAVISSGGLARYVIEVNAGQVATHHIRVGQHVLHPAINQNSGDGVNGC